MRTVIFQAEPPCNRSTRWQPRFAPNTTFEDAQRLPSASDEVTRGVIAHAQALFEALEGEVGEEMPKAPSEMMRSATGSGSFGQEEEGFWLMDCLARVSPSHARVCTCLASNTSRVVNMLMRLSKETL